MHSHRVCLWTALPPNVLFFSSRLTLKIDKLGFFENSPQKQVTEIELRNDLKKESDAAQASD